MSKIELFYLPQQYNPLEPQEYINLMEKVKDKVNKFMEGKEVRLIEVNDYFILIAYE